MASRPWRSNESYLGQRTYFFTCPHSASPMSSNLQLNLKAFIHFPRGSFRAKCCRELSDEKDPGLALRELTAELGDGKSIYDSHMNAGGCGKSTTEVEKDGEIQRRRRLRP